MEITWYGHSCFRLTERNLATVVTDPYDSTKIGYKPLKLKADIVTVSHNSPGHNNTNSVKDVAHVIAGPGEYEIGNVFITAVQTNGQDDNDNGNLRNILYVFDYDGVTVAHLGDLIRVPTQMEVEALGSVTVALVPVGGGGGLNAAKAAEVISLIEPNIVIPMHYATEDTSLNLNSLDKFMKEMGISASTPEPSLKITRTGLPQETHVVVLNYQQK
ncbi:MAG: MBL fold metallo-hydrolase [Anaerolineae bacterium]|nr:MBL fold metallo-hydrolase [Anaerolineae bacterium]MDK1081761.1 MBL fold metallo-hydrolase [Anaerolineae bacterium]MDK1118227.1 MBL fold metallo-hydrolase [Anaerolineae bacterium]